MANKLSVVLAVKDPDQQTLELCIASFSALKKSMDIEFIVVSSGVLPELRVDVSAFYCFTIIDIPPEGVYSAYNHGASCASGDYILFYGFDDIALPDMDKVIAGILDGDRIYDLIVCASYMQGTGVAAPCSWPPFVLFRNFCHQGIFYKRSVFDKYHYDTKYVIQADHKMNIQVLADPLMDVHFSKMLVSYFSAGGISSSIPDLVFRKDLRDITRDSFGLFFAYVVFAKQTLVDIFSVIFNRRFRSRRKN
jgi:glycosyltransferase involved in cell wall biosynthesis